MRMNKKAITLLAFSLGVVTFVSTAFADIALGSGYDRLKDSIKHTMSEMNHSLDNYTFESLMTLKDNAGVMYQSSTLAKVDVLNKASEGKSSSQLPNGKITTSLSYNDEKCSIWSNPNDGDKYYVTEYKNQKERFVQKWFRNPFDEKGAGEVEKIFDAVVGSLKNYVTVEDRSEGGKVYSGSLSEAQIPALVNAVSSYLFKQNFYTNMMNGERVSLPKIENDIFIQKVTGRAVENSSGILESLIGEITLSGRDNKGIEHALSMEFLMKLSDIGKTTVVKPDLTGKKIEKVSRMGMGFDNRYIGKYISNVVEEKDGKFVKIGERVLEIIGVDDNSVSGKYYEIYKPGYEEYVKEAYNFTFNFDPNSPMSTFTYQNPSGQTESGQLNVSRNGKIYMNLNIEIIDKNSIRQNGPQPKNFDGEFVRVFEE